MKSSSPNVLCLLWLSLAVAPTTGAQSDLSTAPPRATPPPEWVLPVTYDTVVSITDDEVDDGILYLLVDQQTNLATDEHFGRFVQKLTSESGLEQISRLSLSYHPSYHQLRMHSVILRRGDREINKLDMRAFKMLQRETNLERHIYDGSLDAVLLLDDVRVGDILEYAYSLKGSNPVFRGAYSTMFPMQWSVYVHKTTRRIVLPSSRPLHIRKFRTDVEPAVTTRSGTTEYLWSLTEIHPLVQEANIPSWYNPSPMVQVTEYGSWSDVVRWALPMYLVPETVPAVMKAKVAQLQQLPTPREKATAALRFVQDEIRYLGIELGENSHKPTPPEKVFQQRFGDCKDKSLLLCTMLRHLGVTAHPVLVHTDHQHTVASLLPAPTVFDHVIVRVEIGSNVYWVDPTLNHQRGDISIAYIGSYGKGLAIREGSADLSSIPMNPLAQPRIIIYEKFTIPDFTSPVMLDVTSTYNDRSADLLRAYLKRTRKAEIERRYADFYSYDYPDIVLGEPVEYTESERNNGITTKETYTIHEFWSHAEDSVTLVGDFYPRSIGNRVQKPSSGRRTMPYAVEHPVHIIQTIQANMPEQWRLKPEKVEIIDSAFHFTFESSITRNQITYVYSYESKRDAVPPELFQRYVKNIEKARNTMGHSVTWGSSVAVDFVDTVDARTRRGLAVLMTILVFMLASVVALILHLTRPAQPFIIGSLLRSSWSHLFASPGVYLANTLVLYALMLVSIYFARGFPPVLVLFPIGWVAWYVATVRRSLTNPSPGSEETGGFPSATTLLNFLGATVLYMFVVAVGSLFFLVPGIVLAMRLQFHPQLVFDQKLDAVQSLLRSFALTRGVFWNLFALSLATGAVLAVGTLFIGLGLLVALPLVVMVQTSVYRVLMASQGSSQGHTAMIGANPAVAGHDAHQGGHA